MLSLLGSLLGFGGSVIPGILDSFKKKTRPKVRTQEVRSTSTNQQRELRTPSKNSKRNGETKV